MQLDEHQLAGVFDHPVQRRAFVTITELVDQVRAADSPVTYRELQARLLDELIVTDTRRAECSRMHKRLFKTSKAAPNDAAPPATGDPADPGAWELERYVHARVVRQLRAVGDAIAWRLVGYDRGVIAALASNQSPGPLVKTVRPNAATSRGLAHEREQIEAIWHERGNFALLSDITNCLRIGDAVEIEEGGPWRLHEFKADDRNHKSDQWQRMAKAVRSIDANGPLPGSRLRMLTVDVPYQTDIEALRDIIDLALDKGCRGAKLSEGRALYATAFDALIGRTGGDVAKAHLLLQRTRAAAIRRAGISLSDHHLVSRSGDTAARTPLQVPWSIYPFDASVCAALICDRINFEVIVSMETIVDHLRSLGIAARHLLPDGNTDLVGTEPVLEVQIPGRQSVLYPNAAMPMLLELVRPSTWAAGIQEQLRHFAAENTILRFNGDDQPWI